MGAALEIRDLTLRFGGVTALDRLRLSLAPGTVLGLAGPNGSGKSSLINVLTGRNILLTYRVSMGRRARRVSHFRVSSSGTVPVCSGQPTHR